MPTWNKVHRRRFTRKIIIVNPAVLLTNYIVFVFLSLLSTTSPHRCLRLRLRLIAVFVYVFASSLSSWPSSPSSPSRRLCRLRLCRLRLCRLRLCFIVVLAVFSFALHVGSSPRIVALLTRWLPPRLRPIFFVACRDRPQWPSPQGALGNAPVGTSLCRCGGGFLRVCIPCNGFRHRVSPDLSSDKSPLFAILMTRCLVTVV
ncbi:hypothetical protein OUZ56_015805 [Daphnia magna]|uniref:Transmembrane protein n=1 Tax=Daphnia magna TaxID=35525 RepID=A0ABR0ANT4_9CRUS|nr:hypothetical protein OUZ56_015805 [Daphnia magna]